MWTAFLSVCFLMWANANRKLSIKEREEIQITVLCPSDLAGRDLKTSLPLLTRSHQTDNAKPTDSERRASVVPHL